MFKGEESQGVNVVRPPEEVDAVMQRIPREHARWCPAGCGARPGHPDDELIVCACSGCLGAWVTISWDEFCAWEERHKDDPPDPEPQMVEEPKPPSLAERLAMFKERKRLSGKAGDGHADG